MSRWTTKKTIISAVLLGISYYAYHHFSGAPASGGMAGMMGGTAPVSVAEVIQRDVQQWQEFSGRLVAVESAEIRPQVSGVIQAVHFQDGETVKKGQLLFTIDPRPFQAALDAAQARFTLANSEFQRARGLIREKAISQHEYDQRKNAADVARAELSKAKVDYEYTHVTSPVTGRVSRAEITAGNLVSAGSGAPLLATVVADRPIYADFDMDEQSFLQYLQAVGTDTQKVKNVPVFLGLSNEDGAPHPARVLSFDNQLNTGSGTLRVRAVADNQDGALVPGLFTRVRLGSAGAANAVLITDRAVGTDQNKKFVLVLGKDDKVEYRPVTLGGLVDGLRVVREGLSAGEKIVVNGLQRAQPGMAVKPELVPMEGEIPDKKVIEDSKQKAGK